jgi:uncharacterized membrane protein YozB (DUF420 family)
MPCWQIARGTAAHDPRLHFCLNTLNLICVIRFADEGAQPMSLNDIFHAPGFLGTNGNFLADVGLFLVVGVTLIFTVGFVLARMGRYDAHKWVQTTGVVLNLIFVLWLMIGPFIGEVVIDYGEPPYSSGFYWVPIVHGTFGLAAVVFGVFVTLRGHGIMFERLKFNNYKPFMRAAYVLYFITTLLGIGVYLMWFVISAVPPVYE